MRRIKTFILLSVMLITANVCIAQEELRRDSMWGFENNTKNKILNFSFLTNIPPGQLATIWITLYKYVDYNKISVIHMLLFFRDCQKRQKKITHRMN